MSSNLTKKYRMSSAVVKQILTGGILAVEAGSMLTGEAGGVLASKAKGTLDDKADLPETGRDTADMSNVNQSINQHHGLSPMKEVTAIYNKKN